MPAWVPAGATNHFQRQIEAASINKSSSLQEVTFNVNDDYEQVTISESSEVKVVIPETGRVSLIMPLFMGMNKTMYHSLSGHF